jgi:hypothetical protein
MSSDQVRAAFDAWIDKPDEGCGLSLRRVMSDRSIDMAWMGWEACAASHAAEVEALRSVLQRLASTEAFALPRVLHAASDVELLMRIDFARAALKGD